MAVCEKCGNEIKDGVKFCGKCGAPVKKAETAASAASTVQYPYKNNYTEPEDYNIRTLLKKFGGSPLFLIYIIAAIATLVLTIIVSENYSVFGIIAMIILYIPTILCIIGMILGYADARSNEVPQGNGVGLYKAGKIIEIIFTIIVGGVCILLLIFNGLWINAAGGRISDVLKTISDTTNIDLIGTVAEFGDVDGVATVVIIIMIVLVAAIVVLALLYSFFLLFSASAIRKSLDAGKRIGYISLYPAVLMIIGAVCSVISLLGAVFSYSSVPVIMEELSDRLGETDINAVISGAAWASTIGIIMFGLMALKYIIGAILLINLKSKIRED